jgi:HD-GYP domain-containing protein (c-di-GMP phosphodiesterase class II)
MSDPQFASSGDLAEENRMLREQLEELKKQSGEQKAGGRSGQPIQGMMKLLKTKNDQIEETVRQLQEANVQLQNSYEQTVKYYKNTITALSSAMEAKDPFFQFHSSNVDRACRKMAAALELGKKEIESLSTAALIHDFGNIGVRSSVLHKEGPLDAEELHHVQTHPMVASIILEPIGDLGPVIEAVKYHHEAFDGSGYPEGRSGDGIPLFSKILFIAECWDAITTPRPYRDPMPKDLAKEDMRSYSGTLYDPAVLDMFLQLEL